MGLVGLKGIRKSQARLRGAERGGEQHVSRSATRKIRAVYRAAQFQIIIAKHTNTIEHFVAS